MTKKSSSFRYIIQASQQFVNAIVVAASQEKNKTTPAIATLMVMEVSTKEIDGIHRIANFCFGMDIIKLNGKGIMIRIVNCNNMIGKNSIE